MSSRQSNKRPFPREEEEEEDEDDKTRAVKDKWAKRTVICSTQTADELWNRMYNPFVSPMPQLPKGSVRLNREIPGTWVHEFTNPKTDGVDIKVAKTYYLKKNGDILRFKSGRAQVKEVLSEKIQLSEDEAVKLYVYLHGVLRERGHNTERLLRDTDLELTEEEVVAAENKPYYE